MSDHPAITRIRPISMTRVDVRRASPGLPTTNPPATTGGASATVALGSLIVGLGTMGLPVRRR